MSGEIIDNMCIYKVYLQLSVTQKNPEDQDHTK